MAGMFGIPQARVSLLFDADGKTLHAVGNNGMLATWDWQARKDLTSKALGKDSPVAPVSLPNLRAVLTTSGGEWDFRERATESLYLWNLASTNLIKDMPLRTQRENGYTIACTGIAAATDERILASSQVVVSQSLRGPVYHDPILCLWERVTGKEVLQIKGTLASALAFSHDGRLLAADDGGKQFFHGSIGSKSLGANVGLWDSLTGERQSTLSGHTAPVHCLAFSPDGKTLASGSADHTVLIWKTPPRKEAKPAPATAEQMQRAWDDLGADDAAVAHQAGIKMILSPEPAVALIRTKARPAVGVDRDKIAPLIKDLDSPRFQVREQAARQLEAMRDLAEPALRTALANAPSLEVKRRLDFLLEKAAVNSPAQVHQLRILTVLERIADPDARRVLESLSRGSSDSRFTQEAQASLRRLGVRIER
jgi:hypothetical protein